MKYLFYFILYNYYLFYNSLSTSNPTENKKCINCKHFIKNNQHLLYSKCFLFPQIGKYLNDKEKNKYIIDNVVTGITYSPNSIPDPFFYCTTAREFDFMCGIEGKKYDGKKDY
jgi:hypothetical protein